MRSVAALLLALIAHSAVAADGFGALLDELRLGQDVPGVSATVVTPDEVLFAGGSGVTDLHLGQSVSADSVFYAGSLSKIMTAVLVLQLVEQDGLTLDEPVTQVGRQKVTVRQLLTHAAGLAREGDFGYWFTADFPDTDALAAYLASTELRSPPGGSFRYSNIGYAALGSVVEDKTDEAFTLALRRRVLEPLEMSASGARGPAPAVANGYSPPGRVIPSAARPFAGLGEKVGERYVRMYHDARAMSPAFGAYTTAGDLGRLAQFLLGDGGDGVLSGTMRRRMFEEQDSGWGLGIRIEGRLARHGGWFAAHRSHFILDLENRLGVAVLANSDNADPGEIADALLAAALATMRTRY